MLSKSLSESLSHFKQQLFKIPVNGWLLMWYFCSEIPLYNYLLHYIKQMLTGHFKPNHFDPP